MPADRPTHDRDSPRPRSFQFTLRSLLVATTLTAIFLSCLFGGSTWVAMFAALLVVFAVPVVLITILVYGRGYQRTFCIGALTFAVATLTLPFGIQYEYILAMGVDDGLAPRCYVLIGLLTGILIAAAFGLLAVMVRRMVESDPSTTEDIPDGSAPEDHQDPFG